MPCPSDDGGCLVRGGSNQPMCKLALAHLLVVQSELDLAVHGLCAPTAHPTIGAGTSSFMPSSRTLAGVDRTDARPSWSRACTPTEAQRSWVAMRRL